MTVGTRAKVFHGQADRTPGGLRKKDLYKNKRGRIVSLKKSKTAKNWNPLKMLGLLSKSGEPFGARTFRKGTMSKTRRGTSGQRVRDFITHKGTLIKKFGKKVKAYSSKKFKRFGRGGSLGNSSLGYSDFPGNASNSSQGPDVNTAQMRALNASGGRHRGGMAQLNEAYDTPLARSLDAGM